ncbi:MAG: hypothetical protein AB8I08_33695 [Sandaracinaceae bacterium]
MSAQDHVYLHDNGDRVELLVAPGLIHVVEMPYHGPARRVPKHGFEDPKRVGRAYVSEGYQPIREQPVARVLVDVAPDAVDRVQRVHVGEDEWARRVEKKAFVASLTAPLTRREAWALLRYVRMRHGRVLVLDATTVGPLNPTSSRYRQPLRKWLEAIAEDDGDPFDEILFCACRFHRDDMALLEAIVPRAPAVGFVGGMPRKLDAFAETKKLTIGCRVPEGLVPAAAFDALLASGADPVTLSVELGRAQVAPAATADALFAWVAKSQRMRSLSIAGCALSFLTRLAESTLPLERVHWEGRVDAASLERVLAAELPFRLSIGATPGSDRGLAAHLPDGVDLEETGPRVCPWR